MWSQTMSIYFSGELTISDTQKKKIIAYLEMTGEDTALAEAPNKQKYVLTVLDAFGHDPLKAAQAHNAAAEKAQQAMVDCYEQIVAQAPFPEKKNFLLKFGSVAEGRKKWQQVKDESKKRFNEVIDQEFWSVVESCYKKQLDKSTTIQ